MHNAFDGLRGGLVLAELGGYGDGPFCATHGAGAALVLLGTYIVDPGDSVPYPPKFVFKPGRRNYDAYLREHVAAARASGAKVGVSVISVALEDSVDFLAAAQEAGADFASLCAHSVMEMFTRVGLGEALCLRRNRAGLDAWATALVRAVTIPVIFKIGIGAALETVEAVDALTACGVPGIHINVGSTDAGSAGLRMLGRLKGRCGFLIGGGGITDREGVRRVLEAGADAAALGTAAMNATDSFLKLRPESCIESVQDSGLINDESQASPPNALRK